MYDSSVDPPELPGSVLLRLALPVYWLAARAAARSLRTCCSSPSTRFEPIVSARTATSWHDAGAGPPRRGRRPFADATAHAPLTYPSHVGILTGRYPANFGVRLNGMNPLPEVATTIAERSQERRLSNRGSGRQRRSSIGAYGLDQGFDAYDDRIAVRPTETMALAELQRSAVRRDHGGHGLAEVRPGWAGSRSPYFLWAHYYDPHLPYSPPRSSPRPHQVARTMREDCLRRRRDGSAAECHRSPPHRRHRHGRSRRVARRSWRVGPRVLSLRFDASRPAHRCRARRRVWTVGREDADTASRSGAGAKHRYRPDDRGDGGHRERCTVDGESLVAVLEGAVAEGCARVARGKLVSAAAFRLERTAVGARRANGNTLRRRSPSSTICETIASRVRICVNDRGAVAARLAAEIGRLSKLGVKESDSSAEPTRPGNRRTAAGARVRGDVRTGHGRQRHRKSAGSRRRLPRLPRSLQSGAGVARLRSARLPLPRYLQRLVKTERPRFRSASLSRKCLCGAVEIRGRAG